MTDQEINEVVARKLGWVQCCNPKTMENGKIVDCFGWSKGGSHFHEPYPDYCHSIEAAWEIVEKLNLTVTKTKEGHWYAFPDFDMSETDTDEWYFKASEENWPWGSLADTAPMAICLAFLKLKEEE